MKSAHSRYFLPEEMFLSFVSIALGVCGAWGSGPLRAALQAIGEDNTWPLIFTLIGAVRLWVTVLEWTRLRGAPARVIFIVSSVRSVLAACCFVAWLSAICLIVAHSLAPYMTFMLIVGTGVLFFNGWSFWENMKVRYALNPKVATPSLQYRDRRV